MRASKIWMLALTILLLASMASNDVVCVLGDHETVLGNSATGYVPSVWTQTTSADFLRGSSSGTVVAASGSVVLETRYTDPGVYVLAGGSSSAFYRFNITSRTWAAMAPFPATLGEGSSLVYDGSGHLYALAGGSSRNVYRYDVLTNAWGLFATSPATLGTGGDMTWDGTYLYILRGSTGLEVWRLDLVTLAWTTLTRVPSAVGTGASFEWQNGMLYVTRGGGMNTFWRYTLSTGTWNTLANSRGSIGSGADMVIGPGGVPYCTYSSTTRQLEVYNPGTNRWSTLSPQLYNVKEGGGLAYDGSTTIYSINGNNQRYFFAYNQTLDSWGRLTDLPAAVNAGGCIAYVPPVRIGYQPSGTFVSQTFDTGAAGIRFVQAFWDVNFANHTTVTLEARASDSLVLGVPNGPWQPLGSGGMSGLTGRYVQWRATLATDDISASPELQEVRVYYYRA